MITSLRADGSRECTPDDTLREAIRRRHSGMRRQAQTWNLEIPGSMLRIAPE
jgi:hypothetical protein